MELSCQTARYPEDGRPTSCKFVELHVLYVPDDHWDVKLNKVPAEAIERFVSAGFISVKRFILMSPLKTLRGQLGSLLGAETNTEKFSFLKCVGRSLALVKSKQESDLKVKTFAPPYAPQPELYLLPAAENHSSVCSASLESEQSFSSSEAEGEHGEEELSSDGFQWAEQECRHQSRRAAPSLTLSKGKVPIRRFWDGPLLSAQLRNKTTLGQLVWRSRQRKKKKEEETSSRGRRCWSFTSRIAAQCWTALRDLPSLPGLGSSKRLLHPGCHKTRKGEELMEEVMLVRAERKQLEWTRQELLRKGKDLLAQNRHRRNQARDGWKKKYFETKKDTVPLEEKLRGLQQQLEMFYHKLLQQLQARDQRGKPRHRGRSSVKNELIIQIMTETHEIDTLKRKMEDAKMKLLTETRLRKQAATELRALKAELAQKKSHTQPL
uniref:Spermatosis associated 1 n=1 Tax=Tetraodon nigroviridis TaxID=99883 RepID=H3BXY8_TETNG